MRVVVHPILHILVPLLVAYFGYREHWVRGFLILLSALLIDLDHLFADPVFDPNRCSIGFHPLHGGWAITGYALITIMPRTRLLGVGLFIHILLDVIDCLWMQWG